MHLREHIIKNFSFDQIYRGGLALPLILPWHGEKGLKNDLVQCLVKEWARDELRFRFKCRLGNVGESELLLVTGLLKKDGKRLGQLFLYLFFHVGRQRQVILRGKLSFIIRALLL